MTRKVTNDAVGVHPRPRRAARAQRRLGRRRCGKAVSLPARGAQAQSHRHVAADVPAPAVANWA